MQEAHFSYYKKKKKPKQNNLQQASAQHQGNLIHFADSWTAAYRKDWKK